MERHILRGSAGVAGDAGAERLIGPNPALARRCESDFFLAGRGLPWWLPAASVISTHTATDTPMWITGVIYANGLRGWMAGLQVFMNMFILGWVGIAMGKVGADALGTLTEIGI